PEPQGERTAAALRARGHDVMQCSLLHIENISAELGAGPWAAVLMTSANAARAVAAHPRVAELKSVPVFVVGQRTAEAARAAGFTSVASADGDVVELAGLVSRSLPRGSALLYLAGEDRAGDLPGRLRSAGFAVTTSVIYRAIPAPLLPDV